MTGASSEGSARRHFGQVRAIGRACSRGRLFPGAYGNPGDVGAAGSTATAASASAFIARPVEFCVMTTSAKIGSKA
ncbi:hypothetical protein, partial [Streptomyces sp. NPDC005166]